MESNARSVVSQALAVCRDRSLRPMNTVVAFMVHAMEANDAWKPLGKGLSLSSSLSSQQTAEMAKLTVDNMPPPKSPAMATLSMQASMEAAYIQQQETVESEYHQREDHKESLLLTILSPALENEESPTVLKSILGKVLEYVAFSGGMEHATKYGAAHDEVRAAMESVFPVSMLSRFLTMPLEEKQTQIEELANIVLGIILYNKEIGTGGNVLPNSREVFHRQAEKINVDLEKRLEAIDVELDIAHNLIDLRAPSVAPNEPEMLRLTAEVANRHQHAAFLNRMHHEVKASMESAERLDKEINDIMLRVVESIGEKSSVPKSKIYPLFEEIGGLYMALRDEHRLMVVHYRLLETLDSLQGQYAPVATKKACHDHRHDPKGAPKLAQNAPPVPSDLAAAEAVAGTVRVFPESLPESAVLSMAGFCPVTIVRRMGLLVPGKLDIGIAAVGENLYACGGNEELAVFCASPDAWIAAAKSVILSMPDIIYLTNLHHIVPSLSMKAMVELMKQSLSCDSGTQTPTHIVEKYIDVNYSWNEWVLRRRALQMANLRDKKTHSQQTHKSHFRRDSDTQVWLPKKASTQTAYNKGQSMPQKKRYIGGLRGSPATKMNIVSLDLDIGQPHQRKF